MILSDRTLREQLESGRIVIDPLDPTCIQPSSVDLHLDRYFRVFLNHTMSVIDVKEDQEELTELVEIREDDCFILHPGEFVLGSTLERVAVPDDLVARLEGKSSLGRLGLLIHSSLPGSETVLVLADGELVQRPIEEIVRKRLEGSVVSFDPDTFEVGLAPITGWYEGPPDRIFEVRLASGRRVRVTAGHNLFTLDREGALVKVRTGELRPGTRVALPARIPDPGLPNPVLDIAGLVPEAEADAFIVEGPTIERAFDDPVIGGALRERGVGHVAYYRRAGKLPLPVVRALPELRDALTADDQLKPKGGKNGLPARLAVDQELAWFLGIYVAEGYRRRHHVVVSNTDAAMLDRVAAALTRLGLPYGRQPGIAVTCSSTLLAALLGWLGVGGKATTKRLPSALFGWPDDLIHAFLEGLLEGDGSRTEERDSVWTSSAHLRDDLLLLGPRVGIHHSHGVPRPTAPKRERGDLGWDEVIDVVDTGEVETIFDLEVRPGGAHIENFLAGTGGVFVSNTAGFVDAGFDGHLTLELSNVANLPIKLYPGMKIGQISFLQMTTAAEHPYGSAGFGSKYQGQRGPTPSRYFENFLRD